MKILSLSNNPILTIVCCQHGDERFGLTVFDVYKTKKGIPIQLILANEKAVKANKRFTETDLNRSFPGSVSGSYEEKIAHKILPQIKKTQYLIDIHTTSTDIKMTPIVTTLTEETKQIINLTSSEEVAFIEKPLGDRSLIGQVKGGVSLEFNRSFSKTKKALNIISSVVDGIVNKRKNPDQDRKIFHITGTIPNAINIPEDARNFKLIPGLDVYPFLLEENSYKDIHALSGTWVTNARI